MAAAQPQEFMNVLDPQHSRYINLREDLEEYLAEKYGPETEYRMTDFQVIHENDRWCFNTPEKLTKKQVKEMIKTITARIEKRREAALAAET